jgi:hypothetical protein
MDMKLINKYTNVDYMNIDTAQETNQETNQRRKRRLSREHWYALFRHQTDCSCSASRGRALCRAAHPRPIANSGGWNVLAARGSHGADDARRRRSISSPASSLRSLTERDDEAGERGEVKEGAARGRTWPPTGLWASLHADRVAPPQVPPEVAQRSNQHDGNQSASATAGASEDPTYAAAAASSVARCRFRSPRFTLRWSPCRCRHTVSDLRLQGYRSKTEEEEREAPEEEQAAALLAAEWAHGKPAVEIVRSCSLDGEPPHGYQS